MTPTTRSGRAVPTPRLRTLDNVRDELSRLYRRAVRTLGDQVSAQDASRLAHVLDMIRRCINDMNGGDLTTRIEALEHRLKLGPAPSVVASTDVVEIRRADEVAIGLTG